MWKCFYNIDPFTFPKSCYNCLVYYIYIHWKPHQTILIIVFAFNYQIYFKELKRRRIVYYIYPDICHLYCYSLTPDAPNFPLVSFLVLRTSISNSFKEGLLVINSVLFSFPSSWNIFISPSFLTDIFTGYKILGWHFFQLFKIVPFSSCLYDF